MTENKPITPNDPPEVLYPFTLLIPAISQRERSWNDDLQNCNRVFRAYLGEDQPTEAISKLSSVIMHEYLPANSITLNRYPRSNEWSQDKAIRGITFYPDEQGELTAQRVLEYKTKGTRMLTTGSAATLASLVHEVFRASGMQPKATSTD